MSQSLADLLNIDESFEYQGKKYRVSELTLEQRARFGRWLRNRTAAALTDPDMPDGVRKQLVDSFTSKAATAFEFDSPAGVEALHTVEGQAYALYLCAAPHHPEVDEELAREIVAAKWTEIGKLITEKLADPKVSAAVKAFLSPTSPPSSSTPRSGGRSKKSKTLRRPK